MRVPCVVAPDRGRARTEIVLRLSAVLPTATHVGSGWDKSAGRDAPSTRGQMAVFLAKALGLHWAP